MSIKTVVAATDFSDYSLTAIETAMSLTLDPGSTLYLVHVLDLPAGVDPMAGLEPSINEMERTAVEKLAALEPENRNPEIQIEEVVIRGNPPVAIADFAREKDADMIVVGTHGRGGLARIVLGSTAETLLRKAPCQVLVAKHKGAPKEPI